MPNKKISLYSPMALDDIIRIVQGISCVEIQSISDFLQKTESSEADWTRFDDLEDLGDIDIYRRITRDAKPTGTVYAVSDASYSQARGGFVIDNCNIEGFIKDHRSLFGECFFNMDTFIFSIEQRLAWIFHHEGVFVVARGIFHKKNSL